MEIGEADRAVVVKSLVHTFMVFFHRFVQAASTAVAVIEVFFSSNSTYAAFIAVVDAFLVAEVIIKVAYITEVNSEILLASRASFAFWLLKHATETFDVSDGLAIELVVLLWIHFLFVADLIVAKPAGPKLAQADWVRTLFLAASFVMFATKLPFVGFKRDRRIRVVL